jgi:Cu/Ag efflux pump CusA
MRYTKAALLLFGLGLVLGFALIVAEVPGFGWMASGVMALGLVALPVGLLADGRVAFVHRILSRFSRKKRAPPPHRVKVAASRAVGRPARRRPSPARAPRRRRR